MARRPPLPPLARTGFAIALVAFAVMMALGYSRQVITEGDSTIGCGSVLSPAEDARCEDLHSGRRGLMLAIGIPGVVVGLGIVIFDARRRGR